jgi:hypothetical protein
MSDKRGELNEGYCRSRRTWVDYNLKVPSKSFHIRHPGGFIATISKRLGMLFIFLDNAVVHMRQMIHLADLVDAFIGNERAALRQWTTLQE